MNRNLTRTLLLLMLLLFNSCEFTVRSYQYSYESHSEYSYEDGHPYTDKQGRVFSDAQLNRREDYSLLHSYFQPIFPKWRENYEIEINVKRHSRDADIEMQYVYLEECRIVLPSGKVIDLLDNITLRYIYQATKQVKGKNSEILPNVQPQYINNKKAIYIEGIAPGGSLYEDSVCIESNAAIPSNINSLRLEYTLTVVWENIGAVKKRCKETFKKGLHTYYPFSV